MKVTNLGLSNASLGSSAQVESAAAGSGAQAATGTSGSQAYTPSADLLRLLNLVGQQPDVREERVQASASRLQQGYYQTQASAAQTAAAMMNALD